MPRVFGSFFLRAFDFFPIHPDFIHAFDFCFSENMRMAANEFFHEQAADAFKVKSVAFARELAMKDHLQQQVAEFFCHFVVVARLDGVNQLIHFLNRMTAQSQVRLLPVPGTTRRRTQLRHDTQQIFNGRFLFHCRIPL